MDREIAVYVDLDGTPRLVGQLWSRVRRGSESATFKYDPGWVRSEDRFSLEPALEIGPGEFHTADKALFGAIGDSAPDTWGRTLMRRAELRRAEEAGVTPRSLFEIDFLLMVNDETRQGALRFAERVGGEFLADNPRPPIPPFLEIGALLAAAQHVDSDKGTTDELRLLLAPGSSLGGARPKASVRDRDSQLAIAKFPKDSDQIDVVRWEAIALALARKARIEVPDWRLEVIASRPVLISRRFDRRGAIRIPYISAMSMLDARDGDKRSYMELVDTITMNGAAAIDDKRELWRRMVFNILISNTDDHLRNHGFLYSGPSGWRLAPAYDLNPVPVDIKPRFLATSVTLDDDTASLGLALEVAPYFELDSAQAAAIVGEVGSAVSSWRDEAKTVGISRQDADRMSSAFEHEDLISARALG
ncbi:MAG TPA: type II toxin-antitoxin system HipA family toxin [Candidatus Eremiobacteraceae bacterium]